MSEAKHTPGPAESLLIMVRAARGVAGDIEGYLVGDWDGNSDGWRALANRLRAAIAKAEGGGK